MKHKKQTKSQKERSEVQLLSILDSGRRYSKYTSGPLFNQTEAQLLQNNLTTPASFEILLKFTIDKDSLRRFFF